MRVRPGEAAQLDARVRGEDFRRPVGLTVVEDHIAIDEAVVMPEEERQHKFFIPALRIEIDAHRRRPP
jgi:hypothetical protein